MSHEESLLTNIIWKRNETKGTILNPFHSTLCTRKHLNIKSVIKDAVQHSGDKTLTVKSAKSDPYANVNGIELWAVTSQLWPVAETEGNCNSWITADNYLMSFLNWAELNNLYQKLWGKSGAKFWDIDTYLKQRALGAS